MAHAIEPAALSEPAAVDNKRFAFPSADRIAHPSGVGIVREWPAIQEDLAENGVLLVKDNDDLRRLDDFPRKWNGGGGRHARRLALRRGAKFPLAVDALFEQRHGPGLDRGVTGLEVRHDVDEIARGDYIFDVLRLPRRIGLRQPDA